MPRPGRQCWPPRAGDIAGRNTAVQQAELELLPQHPPARPVNQAFGHGSGAHGLLQRLAEAANVRQLHVHAGPQGQRGRLRRRACHPVQRFQEGDAVVVRDDDAVESEITAQQLSQQRVVRGGRHAVEVGIGVHDRPRATGPDRHLERRQEHIAELARADAHRRLVAASPGAGVADEVLERGVHPGGLQSEHVGGAEHANQVRIGADRLLHPAPAGVTGHVEHGRQALMDARRPHASPDRLGHLAHEVGVERGAPCERGREGRGRKGGEPGQALLVSDRRDAEPIVADDLCLQPGQLPDAFGRLQRAGAENPREVAQSVPDQLPQRRHVRGELALQRRDAVAIGGGAAQPDAAQLREFLLQGHPGQQVGDPLGHRAGRVPPRGRGVRRPVGGVSPDEAARGHVGDDDDLALRWLAGRAEV